MPTFQHPLWGYELTYPDGWIQRSIQDPGLSDAEAFAAAPEAFEPGYTGPRSGQVAVRAEWNCARQPIEPLWNQQLGLLAGMVGASKVGSAAWRLRDAEGIEAEIVLPKRENTRLWTGILSRGFTVLHFVVTHPKEERVWFEPAATRLISSLNFAAAVDGVVTGSFPAELGRRDHPYGHGETMTDVDPQDPPPRSYPSGVPLPPGFTQIDPMSVITDIADPEAWAAYDGPGELGSLQAFYVREAPNFGWEIEEYVPCPSPSELGFARFQLLKEGVRAILGIMPYGPKAVSSSSPAKIVVKYKFGE